jgi:oligopeptide transport system substrate-binding protein
MIRKILALMLAVVMLTAVLAGCGSGAAKNEGEGGAVVEEMESAIGDEEKRDDKAEKKTAIVATVGPEPETIDPALNTAVDSANYINHVFEGLTRIDKNGKTVAGVAKEWIISDDGAKYTFFLREDAKWSDGKRVTAHDFEYAWKRALDPEVASWYAYMLYYLKNAEEYNMGKVDPDDVGVRAIDDMTLEVVLKTPTSYFLDLCNFPTYMPVRKDVIEKYGDKWTLSAESYVGNGPYRLMEWNHDSDIIMKRNENYWDEGSLGGISRIRFVLTDDNAAALNAFESGEHNYNDDLIPAEELPRLISDGKTVSSPELSVNYVVFNVKKPPLDNPKVRKALSLAIDRKFIVKNVLQGGQKVAVGFIPYGTPGLDPSKDFRAEEESASFLSETADIEEAKKLLAEAGYPDGKGLPEIEYSTNSDSINNRLAEALQAQWAQIGVKVKISTMEWKVFGPYRAEQKYTIARGAWAADYIDPMTFLDMFLSNSPNNEAAWSNERYDELIKKAQSTNDQQIRMPAMHEAEKILLEEMPISPISFPNRNILIDPKLKGVYRNAMGFVYFQFAYWEE